MFTHLCWHKYSEKPHSSKSAGGGGEGEHNSFIGTEQVEEDTPVHIAEVR